MTKEDIKKIEQMININLPPVKEIVTKTLSETVVPSAPPIESEDEISDSDSEPQIICSSCGESVDKSKTIEHYLSEHSDEFETSITIPPNIKLKAPWEMVLE